MSIWKNHYPLLSALFLTAVVSNATAAGKGNDDEGQPKEVVVVNTESEPVPVAIQGSIEVDVQSQSSVDINSLPAIDINTMPAVDVFNGDHPALTPAALYGVGTGIGTGRLVPLSITNFPEYCDNGTLVVTYLSGKVNLAGADDARVSLRYSNRLVTGTGTTVYATTHHLKDAEYRDAGGYEVYFSQELDLIADANVGLTVIVDRYGYIGGTMSAIFQASGYCFQP